MFLQTNFRPASTNTTVHQLKTSLNHVNKPRSPNKYKTPTTNTAQLNHAGQTGHGISSQTIAFAFLFTIIISPHHKFHLLAPFSRS